jgi:hypothetical protein
VWGVSYCLLTREKMEGGGGARRGRAERAHARAAARAGSVRWTRHCTTCPLAVVRAGGGRGASRRWPRDRVRAPSGGKASSLGGA